MGGPTFRVLLAAIIALVVLYFLFHSAASSMQPTGTVHSTLVPGPNH